MSMLTPEEHLDAALGQLAPSRRAEAGPDDERAIADLERFLASVRREASSPGVVESEAAARVVEGVLGASTRQDLTWRGDLRLVRGFVQRRLAQSPSLRAVAALLLLQVLLAPGVLAFLALRPAPVRPEVRLGLELPGDAFELREAEQKLSEALPLPELQEALPGGSLRATQARAVGWLAGLELETGRGASDIGAALAWRAALARPRSDGGVELSTVLRQRAELDLAVRAIVLEAELDRVCRGSLLRDPESAAQALLASAPEAGSPLEAELWEAAQSRARGLGLLIDAKVPGEPVGVSEAWVERVLAVTRERGEPSPLR
ncbi:MAG: hypothetical protein ISQ08_01755 [Planctomycetes bacterium]|nr:hypothetical protein [Planctomycetota bacterium]MDA0947779.1 hypothetical protein [Planctomycetota bacterium]